MNMGGRFRPLMLFAGAAAVPLGWASAQQVPAATQPAPTVPAAEAPAPPPAPVELPPPLWEPRDAMALLSFIQQIGGEGLDPADYDPAGLTMALRSGDPLALAKAATDRFNRVSSDLAFGHVRGDDRVGCTSPTRISTTPASGSCWRLRFASTACRLR